MIIFQAYQQLKAGIPFNNQLTELLRQEQRQILPHQWSSLACLLSQREEIPASEFLNWISSQFPEICKFLDWQKCNRPSMAEDERLCDFLFRLSNEKELGSDLINWWVSGVVEQEISLQYISFCLMTILLKGLKNLDLVFLTKAFTASGRVYDYRSQCGSDVKLIRRYPTGALSEKTALILPSMIAAMRDEIPVATSFLIARSLSFTGGTWDKLSSIPNFTFPSPGEETLRILKSCGVAMTVTNHDVNPADKILYQLRSATGTVESNDLIVSSIVSKQLSFPVDQLLLDVRYGQGAFLIDCHHAKKVANTMIDLLKNNGVNTTAVFTDTLEPNGSSIGNALEVIEAIAILSRNYGFWNTKGLSSQIEIVCLMFANLFSESFPSRSFQEWFACGKEILDNGKAYDAFLAMLRSHCVHEETIQKIQKDPWRALLGDVASIPIISSVKGIVRGIDQKKLGFFTNFALGGAGSPYACSFNSKSGIRLNKLLGDTVCIGEILGWVITDEIINVEEFNLQSCFIIN